MNREEALVFRLPLEKDSGGITVIYSNTLRNNRHPCCCWLFWFTL